MKIAYLFLTSLVFLVGCSQEPPKCSDKRTLELVRQIISNELTQYDELSKKDVIDNLRFEFPKASAFEKEIKKLSCESKLIVGGNHQVSIQYESQLDDNNQHIVSLHEVLPVEMARIRFHILESLKNRENNIIQNIEESQELSKNEMQIVSSQEVSNTSLEKMLSSIYNKYIPSKQCWVATDSENEQQYCMKIDSNNKINAKGINRLYVILKGNAIGDNGEDNNTHALPGLIGAFVMEEYDGELKMTSYNSKILMGSFGNAPEKWRLVKIGEDDYYGWTNESSNMNQGYSSSVFHILAPYGSEIKDLGNFISSSDDSGACADESCQSTSLNATIEFDSATAAKTVFPVIVTVNGKEKGKENFSKKYTFQFNDEKWQYQLPEDYILSN